MSEPAPGRSSRPRKFFTDEEQRRIAAAIAEAERRTSGEIRLHVERGLPARGQAAADPYLRAREIFARLGMHRTAQRNGVLVYLALRDRRLAVVGDEELHARVGDPFWAEVVGRIGAGFQTGDFAGGLAEGIALIGQKLQEHFPWAPDDRDELPDEISFEP